MKRKANAESGALGITPQRNAFELMMNLQCDLRAEAGLQPMPNWKQTRKTPQWTKNICQKLKNTILKPVLKLKPRRRKFSWRNYGRTIGIIERYKIFLAKDVPAMLKEDGLDKIGKKRWAKIQPLLGEKDARQYYLKILGRPANDKTSFLELAAEIFIGGLVKLEQHKQTAFAHLANQSAKTYGMFLKGMSEGYKTFLNEEGEFSGDDRRTDIHLELIAWQYEIEKMRKSVLPKTRNDLFREIKKLPEFKNKTQAWFNDVLKDIKLTGWKRGHPYQFSSP
jgi:hypothetical protein